VSEPHPIVFVNNFTGSGLGGGEVHMRRLVMGARDAGMDVHVICCPGTGVESEMRALGATVSPDDLNRKNPWASASRLVGYVRKHDIELIHSNGYLTSIISRIAQTSTNACVINSVLVDPKAPRLAGASWLEQMIRDRFDRITIPRADALVPITQAVADGLLALGADPDRITVIPGGVDIPAVEAELAEAAPVSLPVGDGPLIGMAGRLEQVKGPEEFVRMAALVAAERPDARFVVAGGGSQQAVLVLLAVELDLGSRLSVLGHVPSAVAVLDAVDVVVVPSRSEGFGITPCEAGALGKPVVATDAGGLPEVVTDGVTGLLVPSRDPEALAAAVLELLGDPERAKRMGEAGRERVTEHFTVERMVKDYLAIYRDLIGIS
jgi:glycosyltransferase involved in cell wall biosynthesis